MGLFNLSSVKNHPRRSGFDLSSKVAFSAKVGELLPIKWSLTMPGDKFSLKEQHFTRTQPVNTSAHYHNEDTEEAYKPNPNDQSQNNFAYR